MRQRNCKRTLSETFHEDLSSSKLRSDLWGMEFNYAGSKHLSFIRRENSFNTCNIFWLAGAFTSCLRERSLSIHELSIGITRTYK